MLPATLTGPGQGLDCGCGRSVARGDVRFDDRRKESKLRLRRHAIIAAAIALTAPLVAAADFASAQAVRQIAPERIPNYGASSLAASERPALRPATREEPYGSCKPGDRNWSICLVQLITLMDSLVDDAVAEVEKGWAQRSDVPEGKRELWTKNLQTSQTQWRALKEVECGVLSTAETVPLKNYFELRANCNVQQALNRIEDLRRRFGEK